MGDAASLDWSPPVIVVVGEVVLVRSPWTEVSGSEGRLGVVIAGRRGTGGTPRSITNLHLGGALRNVSTACL